MSTSLSGDVKVTSLAPVILSVVPVTAPVCVRLFWASRVMILPPAATIFTLFISLYETSPDVLTPLKSSTLFVAFVSTISASLVADKLFEIMSPLCVKAPTEVIETALPGD